MTAVVTLFHSDGPQHEFKSREQKGGQADCAHCSGDARRSLFSALTVKAIPVTQ